MTRWSVARSLSLAATAAVVPAAVAAQSTPIEQVTVEAFRLPLSASEQLHNTTVFDRAALDHRGGARLDEILREVPGFGLFRRQSSRASHPTTQGMTLRGLGPSGAGRTLVLLDGIPQNDPFGGWVDWSRLSPTALESVAVTRGGGAGAWGNSAMAGVVRVYRRSGPGGGGSAQVRTDSFGGYDASASFRTGTAPQLFGAAQAHGGRGPFLIRKDQRGTADVRADNRGGWAELGAQFTVGDTEVMTAASYSEDRLINGFDIARSHSRIGEASVGLVHDGRGDTSWEAHAYMRRQGFNAVFAAVIADRSVATPSLDQFRVPAAGSGANTLIRFHAADALSIEAGADVRFAIGATHENFTFANSVFTRERAAGGRQAIAGGFAEVSWHPMPALLVSASGRLDYWRQSGGYRRETNRSDGAVVRDETFASTDGSIASLRTGAAMDMPGGWTLKAVAYSGFRIPTLNELYRPFRVGNDITEANALLGPERLLGAESGFAWASDHASWSVTVFKARLQDAVSNITVQTIPGQNVALNVFVPAGGVLRQRRNLDRIVANGVESTGTMRINSEADLQVDYLYTSPTVRKARDQPALEGLRLAQVAHHQGAISLMWRPTEALSARAGVRFASAQFDDDQNARRLRGYTVLDAGLEYRVLPSVTLFITGENVLGTEVEAGISATGIVTLGNARLFAAGTSLRF